jgi:hypothetical protein
MITPSAEIICPCKGERGQKGARRDSATHLAPGCRLERLLVPNRGQLPVPTSHLELLPSAPPSEQEDEQAQGRRWPSRNRMRTMPLVSVRLRPLTVFIRLSPLVTG